MVKDPQIGRLSGLRRRRGHGDLLDSGLPYKQFGLYLLGTYGLRTSHGAGAFDILFHSVCQNAEVEKQLRKSGALGGCS